jgi:hypothetical protein
MKCKKILFSFDYLDSLGPTGEIISNSGGFSIYARIAANRIRLMTLMVKR